MKRLEGGEKVEGARMKSHMFEKKEKEENLQRGGLKPILISNSIIRSRTLERSIRHRHVII